MLNTEYGLEQFFGELSVKRGKKYGEDTRTQTFQQPEGGPGMPFSHGAKALNVPKR